MATFRRTGQRAITPTHKGAEPLRSPPPGQDAPPPSSQETTNRSCVSDIPASNHMLPTAGASPRPGPVLCRRHVCWGQACPPSIVHDIPSSSSPLDRRCPSHLRHFRAADSDSHTGHACDTAFWFLRLIYSQISPDSTYKGRFPSSLNWVVLGLEAWGWAAGLED